MISDKQTTTSLRSLVYGALQFFAFLSILTGHLTLLWYYPLWSMSFTGCEVSLIVLPLSAFLIPKIKNSKYLWITAIMFGLYIPANMPIRSFKLLSLTVSQRLISSTIGLLLSTALVFKSLTNGFHWTLGLFIFTALKYAYVGNIPIWPIVNENYSLFLTVLLIGLFALKPQNDTEYQSIPQASNFDSLWTLKIGSWMYLVDNYLMEVNSIQSWSSSENFQVNRLISSEVITILSLGLTIIFSLRDPIHSVLMSALGFICSLIFYFAPNELLKLCSGLAMKCILLSCLAQDVEKFSVQSSKTISAGLSAYIALSILHMASTAYAFMPLGWTMRERVFIVFIPAVVIALKPTEISDLFKGLSRTTKRKLLRFMSLMLGLAVFLRVFKLHMKPNARPSIPTISDSPIEISNLINTEFGGLPIVRVGIWAIHFGIDQSLYSSEHRIARLIEAMDLDVIGLVESDLMRSVMGQRDFGRLIAAALPTKYHVDYGPSPRMHTWGCTLLSRHPINHSKHFLLPSPKGEIACAILANIQLSPQVSVNVLIAHNGQEEDKLDRQLQTDYLNELVKQHSEDPLIYAGYLVAKPHSDQYHRLFRPTPGKPHNRHYIFGSLYDIDPDIQDRWCLYIGHNRRYLRAIGFARLHHGGITDTELQVGSFAVMPAGKNIPDYEHKWELVVRQVRAAGPSSPGYYQRWSFEEPLSICPVGANTVCEHYYHLKRHYF